MAAESRNPARFTEADGRELAVNMLRELAEWDGKVDERVFESITDENNVPDMTDVLLDEEPEILTRYLATVRRKKSAELERGFLCLLSHFLASAAAGESCLEEKYEDHLEPARP